MRGVFDDNTFEPAPVQQETDLTLGPVMLLGILFVLVLVCAACFGVGYAVGHRGGQDSLQAMKPAPDAQSALQPGCVQPKPSASSQADLAPALDNDADSLPISGTSDTNATGTTQSGEPAAAPGSSSSQPQIRPALPLSANTIQSTQPGAGPGGGLMSPAIAPAGTVMVQIAAVSRQEDADVLMNALRRRGYAVTARREPADSMIHVRIGPFSGRDEANRWSQKLMSDGYNAIVQP